MNPTRLTELVVDKLAVMYRANAALNPWYFGQPNTTTGYIETASVNSTGVTGVVMETTTGSGQEVPMVVAGKETVYFDTTLDEQNPVKVGSSGRATLWNAAQTTIKATVTGEATAVTQPAAASVLTVAQAADVAADRGRVVRVVGSNAAGAGIYEDITLNATNSSTGVDGVVSFTKVSGAYMLDGAVLGAQSVTIKDDDPATLMTIANATSELAADLPTVGEAYTNVIDFIGPNTNTTFLSLVGYKSSAPETLVVERCQFVSGTPSTVSTTSPWRQVTRICLGEFTNGGTASVKTDADYDTESRRVGVVVTAGVYGGTGSVQVLR